MSRRKRILRKRFVVFCEGNTEYHYIDSMRRNQGVELSLIPVNMKGGGYANFLDVVKTSSYTNCLAKFILIDADRLADDPQEKTSFLDLLAYCSRQNRLRTVPHFLIVNQPSFDYIACIHDPAYRGQNIPSFITGSWKYDSLDTFKSDPTIYEYLNSQTRGFQTMLRGLSQDACLLINKYKINHSHFEIIISKTNLLWDNLAKRGSNISEFFDVIDWN